VALPELGSGVVLRDVLMKNEVGGIKTHGRHD
jgi:hypothetical protein